MNFNSIALLPHEPNIQVKDITLKLRYVKLLKRSLQIFKEALLSFKSRELCQFDAQVGETLCQIRAYKIAKLSNNYRFEAELDILIIKIISAEKQLIKTEEVLNDLINVHKSNRPEWVKGVYSLTDFLEKTGAFFEFSEEMFFLFLSYFLCLYNVRDTEGIPFTIDYEKISKDFEVSPSYSKRIVQHYQKTISWLSCEFVLKILQELDGKQSLKETLPSLCMSSDEGRKVLPCYAVTDIILMHAIKSKINIIVWVKSPDNDEKHLILSFKGSYGQELEAMDLNLCSNNEPCLVFYGTSHSLASLGKNGYFTRINNVGIKSLILCNNAFHPQYSGKALHHLSYNPFRTMLSEREPKLSEELVDNLQSLSSELETMKDLAKTLGCTIFDQRSFLLKHIFCDTIDRYKVKSKLYANLLTKHPLEEARAPLAA